MRGLRFRPLVTFVIFAGMSACKVEAISNATSTAGVNGGTQNPVGKVTCAFTSSVGMQADSSLKLGVNQTADLSGNCKDESGQNVLAYWYTDNTSVILVQGSPNTITVNGVTYRAGPTATVKAVSKGSAKIFMQASLTNQTVKFSRSVKVE